MTQWQKKKVPRFCERLIGFSVPENNEILVVSYEGTHLLKLGPEIAVETDEDYAEYDLYDPDVGTVHYRNRDYSIIGLHGGNPLLKSPQGETLVLDEDNETVAVVRDGETTFSLKYENFSGGWAAATFSHDGNYIALGCPYEFDFVVLQRVGEPSTP